MKYLYISLLIISTVFILVCCSDQKKSSTTQEHKALTREFFDNLKYPKLPAFESKTPDKVTLDNGLTVFLMEDHELPLMNVTLSIRTGDFFDPSDQIGMITALGHAMKTGGTTAGGTTAGGTTTGGTTTTGTKDGSGMSGPEFSMTLEAMGAEIDVTILADQSSATMSCLSKDFNTVYDMYFNMLKNPRLPQDRIDFMLNQYASSLSRRNDDAADIETREISHLLYGKPSHYVFEVLPSHMKAINRDDIVKFHKDNFHPGNFILGIVGDFNKAELIKTLNASFGQWKAAPEAPHQWPAVNTDTKRIVAVANKTTLVQSNINMAVHCDVKRGDPDYVPLFLAIDILGIRLKDEIRSKAGLAYSVYSYYAPQYDYPGAFHTVLQTKTESTGKSIQLALDTLKTMSTEKISAEELEEARESMLNSFVFSFASPAGNLMRQIRYQYRGLPSDYVIKFQNEVHTTTIEDIYRVCNKYFKPDSSIILVVGNKAKFDTDLSEFGTVTDVDLSLPTAKTKND